jgi:D-alanyl-D-alanine carboxypeptidase (penicillin-binding protein 5/6)
MLKRLMLVGLGVAAIVGVATAAWILELRLPGRSEAPQAAGGPAQAIAFPPSSTNADQASPYPLKASPGKLPVEVGFARKPAAGILFDVDSGEVLWERNPDRRLPIASLTKMMTALVLTERHRPNERVRITPEAIAYEGSGMGVLKKGRKVRFESMLKGLLLVSGNDAAIALAQHDAGTVRRFVGRMNRSRGKFGLGCSRFSSPHGLEDKGNFSCARDLAALARADLDRKRIRKIIGANSARFPFPVKGGVLDLYNNNPFIRQGARGITGVKTGYTDAAGRCYVTTQRVGDRHLGVVLLDSPNPLEQVPALLRAGARRG